MPTAPDLARRPIRARSAPWAVRTATFLAKAGVTPNAISYLSIVCGALAGAALLATRFTANPFLLAALFLLAIAAIQARLLCNLFDGMVAIEGGKKSRSGDIFNDLPDRIADPLILIPIGYALPALPHAIDLAWAAGLLAILTAYVRVLGKAAGTPHFYLGPMAKQHRMALLTAACAAAIPAAFFGYHPHVLYAALLLIILGCLPTLARRTLRIIRTLEST
jgi:phosphatidylglycerophosphate synthase